MIFGKCNCVRTKVWNPKKVCPPGLRLRSIVVMNEDSPIPCGDVIEVDLLEHSDFDVCEEELKLEVTSFDIDAFEDVYIEDNILHIKTDDIEYDNRDFYEIVVKGTCGILGDYMVVYVRFEDPCECEECTDNCGTCE